MTTDIQMPKPAYHFLIATATQFVLVVVALTVLVPTGLLAALPWSMMGFLFAYNILIATLVAVVLTNHSADNKPAVVKGGGLVMGHLVGILLGGFIGLKYGGLAWAIGGAIILYFFAGWIGAHISLTIGAYLDALNAPAAPNDLQAALRRRARGKSSSLFIYGALVPALFLTAAVLVKSFGVPFGMYAHVLPTARTVLVILSVISILMPWLRPGNAADRPSRAMHHAAIFSIMGMGLSLAPAIYGFLLFIGFGLSFAELSLFAIAASVASTTWVVGRTAS